VSWLMSVWQLHVGGGGDGGDGGEVLPGANAGS
jgi:hypothetical protein